MAPVISVPSSHTRVPVSRPVAITDNDKSVTPPGQVGEGEGEGVVLPGCWVTTFEELKVHEPSAVQFWCVMTLLPLFENTFALADVLPIATVLNNIAAIVINADIVDLLFIL